MNEYVEEISKMRWSYSRLSAYNQCKYEFYLQYIVDDDDIYLSEGNFYADVGIYVHDILARIFNKFMPNCQSPMLSIEEALTYYAEHYDENVCYQTKQSTMDKTFELCAKYFTDLNLDWLNDYDVLGVELKQEFELEGYRFIGFIDLLLRDKSDGGIVILDHKSSGYPLKKDGTIKQKSKENFEAYKRQMYLYSYAVKDNYGEFPKEIRWNHFKDGGKIVKIPFNEEEYNASVKWFVDIIHEIEKEDTFEPHNDFFYCKNLCPFRGSCEFERGDNLYEI